MEHLEMGFRANSFIDSHLDLGIHVLNLIYGAEEMTQSVKCLILKVDN